MIVFSRGLGLAGGIVLIYTLYVLVYRMSVRRMYIYTFVRLCLGMCQIYFLSENVRLCVRAQYWNIRIVHAY